MANRYSKFTRAIYLTGDLLLVNVSFAASYYFKYDSFTIHDQPYYVILALYFNIVWVAATFFLKIYDIERVEDNTSIIKNIFRVLFLHALLVAAFIVIREGYYYSRLQLLATYACLTISVITWRLLCIYFFRFYRASGYNRRKVIIIGLNEAGLKMKDYFEKKPQYGYLFCGFFDDHIKRKDVKGRVSDIKEYVLDHEIDEIYCSMSYLSSEQLDELFQFAESFLVRIRIIPNFREIANRNYKIDFYGAYPVLSFHPIPLDDVLNIFTKRIFDIAFSLVVILFLFSWLFPIIAILIKATSKGPVFFKQRRSGKNSEPFWCWKFRTMYVNNTESAQFKLAVKNDSRITPIGAFLRKTSIDELPQFINILLGEMTVVGPRPHAVEVDSMFAGTVNKYKLRHMVKPGLTGLAQIKGFRGNDDELMRNRIKMDLFYIENWSLVLDIKIIFLTMISVLNGDKNAY